ncbi:reactive oxygen species modulator [Tieghemostelium lacteum]|uniref:Reactive oxygen species modulator n=1 Tax=Tieghemostelium lacteum TaxID=361077 RepID=A0A151ZB52_TIELA|nr:reactive oxygen species modulator [Tieghemostelium lacteum]|eukprot:KYQ91183.1 reactive oxygen species modulator [Tieghemostelium lacteum]
MPMPKREVHQQTPVEDKKKTVENVNQCWESIKMGFTMGAAVGSVFGFLVGSISLFGRRIKGRMLFFNLGKITLQLAGTFGVFMGIGGALRCEELPSIQDLNSNNSHIVKTFIFNSNNSTQVNLAHFNKRLIKEKL